jgi:hypothetical protein
MVHLYNLLFTFNQATSQTCYLVNFKNFKPANAISLFVWRNLPLCSQNSNIKSIWELCVVSHCVLFIITNVRVPHERGDRLCPIGPFSLKPDVPKTLLSCGQQLPLSPQGRSVKVKWSLLSRPKETRRTFSLPSNYVCSNKRENECAEGHTGFMATQSSSTTLLNVQNNSLSHLVSITVHGKHQIFFHVSKDRKSLNMNTYFHPPCKRICKMVAFMRINP